MNKHLPKPPIIEDFTPETKGSYSWKTWLYQLWQTFIGQVQVNQLAADPTTAEILVNTWAVYKNTTSGVVKLWCNDAGVMKSVTLA
jgi:hypothetical protein